MRIVAMLVYWHTPSPLVWGGVAEKTACEHALTGHKHGAADSSDPTSESRG